MKYLIKIFSVIALVAIVNLSSFGQSRSDVCSGDFSVPSYKELYGGWKQDGVDKRCAYKFDDDTEGTLFYNTECSKYYVKDTGTEFKYKDLETAIKALYAYKKYGCNMKGNIRCVD
jgi:hypothetical protein